MNFYTFPAFEPVGGGNILQPVLAYGYLRAPGGGNLWTASAWSCSSICYHSAVKPVAHGDSISTYISAGPPDLSGARTWGISMTIYPSGVTTSMLYSDSRVYQSVYPGVIEAHGLTACNQLPNVLGMTWKNISVYADPNNTPLSQSWSVESAASRNITSPSCNYNVTTTSTSVDLYAR
jgi:hypothetical protein